MIAAYYISSNRKKAHSILDEPTAQYKHFFLTISKSV